MKSLLMKKLKDAAAYPLFISAFMIVSVQEARSEALYLLLSPGITVPVAVATTRSIQQKKLKLDENGDLLIQCGNARFTVAYNEPADQFKPSEQQQNPQRAHTATINGISLTASLTF